MRGKGKDGQERKEGILREKEKGKFERKQRGRKSERGLERAKKRE